jgi:hypothetical protein
VTRLHISQDETKCWQLCFEDEAGNLTLISHQFPSPDHLIDDARDLVAKNKVPKGTVILLAPPSSDRPRDDTDPPYCKPAPRRAGS